MKLRLLVPLLIRNYSKIDNRSLLALSLLFLSFLPLQVVDSLRAANSISSSTSSSSDFSDSSDANSENNPNEIDQLISDHDNTSFDGTTNNPNNLNSEVLLDSVYNWLRTRTKKALADDYYLKQRELDQNLDGVCVCVPLFLHLSSP